MNTPQLDIHDLVADLTRTHTHREPYSRDGATKWTIGHLTSVPALIHQLLGSTAQSQGTESQSPGFGSRPAGRIEAIDTLMLIDDEATRWLARLGQDDPNERLDPRTRLPIPVPRATTAHATIAVINRLHGLHPNLNTTQAKALERDIRRWWHQARIITGWDTAAWRPDATCPMCDQRRSLRINLATSSALCVECRELWDEQTIGLLAEHIRTETDETTPTEEAAS